MDTTKFDPKQLDQLSDEEIGQLRDLSDAEIKELAEKFPNGPSNNNYLILEDTRKNVKQLYPASSWKNLNDLRNRLGQKHWVVKSIKSKFVATKAAPVAKVQDLSKEQAGSAEGVKNIAKTKDLGPGGTGNTQNLAGLHGKGDTNLTDATKSTTNQAPGTAPIPDLGDALKTDKDLIEGGEVLSEEEKNKQQ